MEPPVEFEAVAKRLVIKLNKALKGLRKTPKEWNMPLGKLLREDLKMTRLNMEKLCTV